MPIIDNTGATNTIAINDTICVLRIMSNEAISAAHSKAAYNIIFGLLFLTPHIENTTIIPERMNRLFFVSFFFQTIKEKRANVINGQRTHKARGL